MKFLTLIVEWSLENRVIVLAATIIFFFFGLDSARKLKMDAIPDVTTIQVQVITSAPALSPLEIEQYVTFPVERSMSGIPHVEEVRSISRYGLSVVTIVFKDSMNIFLARQLVSERLSDAVNNIPKGYGTPMMGPISTGLGEIYQFTLSSRNHSLMELTTYLNWYINPILKTIPGVVEVNTFGGNVKQYQIVLNMERMQSLEIVMSDVIEALQKNNASMGGGYIEHNKEHFVIVASGLVGSLDDLGKIFIGKTKEGTPISLSMIADLSYGAKLRLGATTKDGGGEVVGAITLMLMKENSLHVSEAVHTKLEDLKKNLPEGIVVETYYDRSVMVNTTIKTVLKNLAEGALFVILVLFLLLGSIRAGLVIAVTIPLGMLFAIVIMRIRDVPGNLMSMGAIDFGLIVDGAVIIVENAVRRLSMAIKEKGSLLTDAEKVNTIKEATIEVRKATIFGETIIAIVYLPVLSLSGVEGKMFIPMAETVLYALFGAFILSLTVVPVLATYILKVEEPEEHETWLFHKFKTYYIPFLDKIMNAKNKVLTVALISIVMSFILFANLGAEFMPELDEGSMLLEVARLPSVSLSESMETGRRIEKALKEKFPELVHAVSRTGSPDIATDPMGIDRTDIYLQLKPKEEWRFEREKLMQALVENVEESVPEVAVSVSQPIKMRTNELIAGIRSDIGVKIFGEDIKTLREIGEKTAAELRKIQGVVDLKIEQLGGLNYLRIKPKRDSLVRYGVSITDVNQVTEILSSGYIVGSVFEGNKRFDIAIKTNKKVLFNLEEIRSLPVRSSAGNAIPLGDLADVYIESGPVQVSHQNQYRRMIVEFNVRGRDMMSVVQEANDILHKNIPLPVGYRFEFGGKYENYISAKNTLLIVVPVTLALILFLLWLAFGEVTPALMIFLNVPFAITGGVLFLFLRNIPFSISAGVGFIALFGVAVLNGLVLISFTKEQEHLGLSHLDAVVSAAHIRLRPVLMTAIVAATGFIPMAVSTSMGAEVQRPLATVVIGGLITASALTLLVLPVVYAKYYELKK
ncbi:MAG TPA: CusA/CzcA family heavy metal efflux RND transporter [Leptospiraceae bacterium]|nr:CusA/CzcA family heavy metal efflux RND transporter [Leptospiraceae bacterium]HMX31559.1 CusA/CzcA family heavy metal efflux RND transporter [Leptospiraceae bacterium]HMY30617.1 CusA/CzcA family heavy metal efflux RND transporter [Leptospiraceae bacterium]HMZ64441.1 CusA/CzcA family heavy metal efflux RND transporter [Leptospiraceae bacterium]HNA06165.1 CusA/CzcA family heavy metal efflux RND transporter [Leptospiraceae bacterium]